MRLSIKHIKLLAISSLLIFAFAQSAKSFHVLFSDCSHQNELLANFSDSEQNGFSIDAEKNVVDCSICDFTFQQANLAVSFQFIPTVVEFGDFQTTSPLLLRSKQQVANQSLRGPPESI